MNEFIVYKYFLLCGCYNRFYTLLYVTFVNFLIENTNNNMYLE